MKHTVKIIFGKEQVNKFHNNENFTEEELNLNVKEFCFETEVEKLAFCKGVEVSVGWTECYILELSFV